MNPTDAFGIEIKVGSKIIHSQSSRSHHVLQSGTVVAVCVTETVDHPGTKWERKRLVGKVYYVTPNGRRRYARRFNMVAVVG